MLQRELEKLLVVIELPAGTALDDNVPGNHILLVRIILFPCEDVFAEVFKCRCGIREFGIYVGVVLPHKQKSVAGRSPQLGVLHRSGKTVSYI